MAGPIQLLCAREARGSGADDGDRAARARPRRMRRDPPLLPRAVHDRDLDLLDRDGVALLDLEHAGGLARSRAEPAGELGEVVRAVELRDRLPEAVAVDEVVPVGDQVSERAPALAKRHPALHAARALVAQLSERQRADELAVVADPFARIPFGRVPATVLQEGAKLAHQTAARAGSVSVVRNPSPPLETTST